MSSRRLGVLISGRGSNLQSMIDAVANGRLNAALAIVISNRAEVPGLQRARDAGIDTRVLPARDLPDRDAYDAALVALLRDARVDLVCLAGFMRLVGEPMLAAFRRLRLRKELTILVRLLATSPLITDCFPTLQVRE